MPDLQKNAANEHNRNPESCSTRLVPENQRSVASSEDSSSAGLSLLENTFNTQQNGSNTIPQATSSSPKLHSSLVNSKSTSEQQLNTSSSQSTSAKKRKASSSESGRKTKRRRCVRWTAEENARLFAAYKKYNGKHWKLIAAEVGNKTADMCNQHYHRVLDPKISKKKWTKEEDELLLEKVDEYGCSAWKKISNCLEGRTDLQCRHRWTRLTKKRNSSKSTESQAEATNDSKSTTTAATKKQDPVFQLPTPSTFPQNYPQNYPGGMTTSPMGHAFHMPPGTHQYPSYFPQDHNNRNISAFGAQNGMAMGAGNPQALSQLHHYYSNHYTGAAPSVQQQQQQYQQYPHLFSLPPLHVHNPSLSPYAGAPSSGGGFHSTNGQVYNSSNGGGQYAAAQPAQQQSPNYNYPSNSSTSDGGTTFLDSNQSLSSAQQRFLNFQPQPSPNGSSNSAGHHYYPTSSGSHSTGLSQMVSNPPRQFQQNHSNLPTPGSSHSTGGINSVTSHRYEPHQGALKEGGMLLSHDFSDLIDNGDASRRTPANGNWGTSSNTQ